MRMIIRCENKTVSEVFTSMLEVNMFDFINFDDNLDIERKNLIGLLKVDESQKCGVYRDPLMDRKVNYVLIEDDEMTVVLSE